MLDRLHWVPAAALAASIALLIVMTLELLGVLP